MFALAEATILAFLPVATMVCAAGVSKDVLYDIDVILIIDLNVKQGFWVYIDPVGIKNHCRHKCGEILARYIKRTTPTSHFAR